MGSPNVKVAIIDGFSFFSSHPDIYNSSAAYNNIDWSSGIDYTGYAPSQSHGMAVAGIISAKSNNSIGIAGICGGNNSAGACVLPFNVIDENGFVDLSVVDNAIFDATDSGARIINMSFGGYSYTHPAINAAITYAKNHGRKTFSKLP